MNKIGKIGTALAAIMLALAPVPAMAVAGNHPLGYSFFCADQPAECGGSGAQSIALDQFKDKLLAVNLAVNAKIKPRNDAPGKDTWSLNPAYGDCEDYALTKRHYLAKAGVPTNAMWIGVYKLPDGQYHAVLLVTTDQGNLVLDNMTDDIRPAGPMLLVFH